MIALRTHAPARGVRSTVQPCSWAGFLTAAVILVTAVAAGAPVAGQQAPRDLATLYDLGHLVIDTNGDSVPDLVNASLLMGLSPTAAEIAAASEVAARLGFETMAMDLPIPRDAGGGIPIVVGRGGLSASGLDSPGVDPASLDSGEGVVSLVESGDRSWLLVLGGDDDGLLTAARLFAGVLPHTRHLSTTHLERVREDIAFVLDTDSVAVTEIRIVQARARVGQEGIGRLVVDLETDDVARAAAALERLAAGGAPGRDTADVAEGTGLLAYPGLASVEVRLAGRRIVRIDGRAPPDPPGPIPSRPGSGAKDDLDLSNVYSGDGLLGGSPFPERVDAVLVPGDSGIAGLPDLAGRLGLEALGLTVPLVLPAASVPDAGSRPTMVLAGTANALTRQLADSGKVDLVALDPGEGLIELVPDAFDGKSALVVTGADSAGAERALRQLAVTFPNLAQRGDDRPTLDVVEQELWDALGGYSPLGQASIGLYKLDRIGLQLADRQIDSADVLFSVEGAAAGLTAYVHDRAASALGLEPGSVTVTVDDRDVRNAASIFEETAVFPSEVDRFWTSVRDGVLTRLRPGEPVTLEARLSEPPELRARLAEEARRILVEEGADPGRTEVRVLSAFKQGYSWLEEVVLPRLRGRDVGEIVIRFRRNDPPTEWPQQAIQTPLRWLHEIYPIDEVLARELSLDLEQIRFEETTEGPTYEVRASSGSGDLLLTDSFEPRYVLRPYFDRFSDYEHVRVTTGWIRATAGARELVSERIVTDPESFWDYYQADVLPRVYDYVMDRHEGLPRGGSIDAPFFGELVVELELSEPDYRLGVDNEIHAPMDALHEEIYFGTLEFFDVLGRNSRGQPLSFPGRVVPIVRPRSDGSGGRARVRFSGFATSRPAVVVRYRESSGDTGQVRLDIPKTTLERPSARAARVRSDAEGLSHLALRVRVDTELDRRDSLLTAASPEQVDRNMVSAEQVVRSLREMEGLRAVGMYTSTLAYPGLGAIEVWAEWSHEQNPDARSVGRLAANGVPTEPPDWRALVPDGWRFEGERLVQWETPMPPGEGHQVLAKMAATFPEATIYRVGRSYLGQDIWAMDLMPAISASHWSRTKATTFKPTVIYSAREHANEVSSTSHVLRHAELLLTDSLQRAKLDRVNVVIHPYTNPDGAQLAYDLFGLTPDYILHAGYLASLGQGAPSGADSDHPIYPEAPVRDRLWERWLPDVFLNPHGYPSHQVVQLFSEYTGLVRQGRVTERNWGFNKGWFMPGFDYVDDPDFPRHKDAAFELRDYITRGINANRDVFELNQRAYARYWRYGAQFDPDVFRLPMTDSVLIEMPLKGSSGSNGGYDASVTIWNGTTEAPDETAYGPWMNLVAAAGLSWDQAVLDYLAEGEHVVRRYGSSFFGGVSLTMERPRPPEPPGPEAPREDAGPAAADP